MHVKKADGQFVDNKSQMIADLVEERLTAASQPVEVSMDLQPINYDPIYLKTIGGQKKQRVYDIGSKGVAFCSSSRASSSSATAAVDEAVEQGVMKQMNVLHLWRQK